MKLLALGESSLQRLATSSPIKGTSSEELLAVMINISSFSSLNSIIGEVAHLESVVIIMTRSEQLQLKVLRSSSVVAGILPPPTTQINPIIYVKSK